MTKKERQKAIQEAVIMKKGETVNIYEDPHTKERIEGKAKLLERIKVPRFKGDTETWKVKFLSDGFICNRFILS